MTCTVTNKDCPKCGKGLFMTNYPTQVSETSTNKLTYEMICPSCSEIYNVEMSFKKRFFGKV